MKFLINQIPPTSSYVPLLISKLLPVLLSKLTHALTPWCKVLLEKLTGSQLVKKFPEFYGYRRLITAKSVRRPSISWARSIQSMLPHQNFLTMHLNPLTPNDPRRGRTAPLTSKVAFYIFIQQIYVLNILNTVYTLRFFSSSKCSLFHNSNIFGSSIIHILYTGCAKIYKKIIPAPKG